VTHRGYAIRPVRPSDVPAVVAMVHELAEFERAAERCLLTSEQLEAALFGERPALFGHVAAGLDDDEPMGFALWFLNYSTWEGVHGLYVRPEARGTGAGRALLSALAGIAVERGYRRLDWWVLDWNPARKFYAGLGAQPLSDWLPYRLEGRSLQALASETVAMADTELV
jgi:GNAT superfamily N-acetyltransferase